MPYSWQGDRDRGWQSQGSDMLKDTPELPVEWPAIWYAVVMITQWTPQGDYTCYTAWWRWEASHWTYSQVVKLLVWPPTHFPVCKLYLWWKSISKPLLDGPLECLEMYFWLRVSFSHHYILNTVILPSYDSPARVPVSSHSFTWNQYQ